MRKVKGFMGVYNSMRPFPSPYFARVRRSDRFIFSRNFKTPEEAAAAYDEITTRIPPGRPGRKSSTLSSQGGATHE